MLQIKEENSEQNRMRRKDDEFHVGCKECEAYGAGEASGDSSQHTVGYVGMELRDQRQRFGDYYHISRTSKHEFK